MSTLVIQLQFVNSCLYLTEHENKQSFWNVLVGRLDYFSFSSNSASECEGWDRPGALRLSGMQSTSDV
jgi:hypothetical protein